MSEMTIWKWIWPEGEDRATFKMPNFARVLSVREQSAQIALWALCDKTESLVEREFAIYPTGGHAPVEGTADFIATVLLYGGALVAHVFEVLQVLPGDEQS